MTAESSVESRVPRSAEGVLPPVKPHLLRGQRLSQAVGGSSFRIKEVVEGLGGIVPDISTLAEATGLTPSQISKKRPILGR